MHATPFHALPSGTFFQETPNSQWYMKDDHRSASYTDDDGNRFQSVFYPEEVVYTESPLN